MSKIEIIEQQVASLRPAELASFRQWFASFDAEAWDREIEADAASGRLDSMAAQALDDHRAGKSSPL